MVEVRLEGIRHSYDGAGHALQGIDLTWHDGGAYALLGPSGCGKTTMLDIMSGLLAPTEGRVYFDGADVTDLPAVERNIAQVFQFPVLYDSMTVEQNMRFPLRNRGVGRAAAQRRVEEVAELLGITHLLRRRARRLPADAKQLVSLARGLVREDVAAILFDEPLTVVDPKRKWALRQAIKRVHAELGHTFVYVTHDQTEALTIADQVVVMNEGQVLQTATPEELFERPAHRFVGNFVGSPGMNFLPCEVRGATVSVAGVDVLWLPPGLAELPGGNGEGGDATRPGSAGGGPDVVVGVRPDFVRCLGAPAPGALPAEARAVRDLGRSTQVSLTVGTTPLVATLAAGSEVRPGPCWVAFEPGRAHLFRDGRRVAGCRPVVPGPREGAPR